MKYDNLFILILISFIFIVSIKVRALPCNCLEKEDDFKNYYEISVTNEDETMEREELIVINLYSRMLTLYIDGKPKKSYPVTIGENKKSPVGEWIIINKYTRPDEEGPLGSRWMGLDAPWGVFGIHGTNKPMEIGRATSEGCIRLHNEHIEELFELVSVNTRVNIIGNRDPIEVQNKLTPGQNGQEVMQLQINLRKNNFNPGRLNGKYNNTTREAVKELEALYGLKGDGVADKNVLYILNLYE